MMYEDAASVGNRDQGAAFSDKADSTKNLEKYKNK
jgi:hypothetical protein